MRPDVTPHTRQLPRMDGTGARSGQMPRLGPENTGVSGGESSMATDPAKNEILRWTARRRMTLIFNILKGEMSEEEGARRHGLTVAEIDDWKERMLLAAHNALRSRPREEDAIKDEQIRRLKQKVGELVIEVDVLREALNGARSTDDGAASDD